MAYTLSLNILDMLLNLKKYIKPILLNSDLKIVNLLSWFSGVSINKVEREEKECLFGGREGDKQ